MKNLTGALAFSLTLLLTTGCPKDTGEGPDHIGARPDASTPTTGAVQGAVPAQPSPEPSSQPPAELAPPSKQAQGAPEALESCVDRWLQARNMDRYGHPEGTMYAGGSPLFNEATGESRDRVEYIFERHPQARQACGGAAR